MVGRCNGMLRSMRNIKDLLADGKLLMSADSVDIFAGSLRKSEALWARKPSRQLFIGICEEKLDERDIPSNYKKIKLQTPLTRINAKDVLAAKVGDKFIFPYAIGTMEKIQKFAHPTRKR